MTNNSSFNFVFETNHELGRSIPKTERTYQSVVNNASSSQYPHREEFLPSDLVNSLTQNRPQNLNFQPPHTNLEKLFSHATEVKGDLESVINALVGIIGPEKGEFTTQANQNLNPSDGSIQHFFTNQNGGNFIWQNQAAPSVNVENVLKIVRASKANRERHQMRYDSSQSSESSREKVQERTDAPLNLYECSMRSLLSDPGYIERHNQSANVPPNRRKHKPKFHLNNSTANTNYAPGDICIKRSKSIKSGSEMGNEFMHGNLANMIAQDHRDLTENCNHWINSGAHAMAGTHSDPRDLFNGLSQDSLLPGTEAAFYKHPTNYSWSPNKEVSNIHDESSCSSFSILSQNQLLAPPQNRGSMRSCYERSVSKKTPSVSVSDSEGSTEPPSPIEIKRIPRLPSLGTQLGSKEGQYELLLINQPEQHHRARYMTEGSRGAVKDRSGNGFPVVQLLGWKKSATLQIFVATEDGRVKPHSFYQACKVAGKQIHSCKERMFDGTGLIEIQIDNKDNQMIILDCIGILKLRNVDVERRAGIQRVKLKSTMAKLVFRVNLPHGDGFFTSLQVTSDPILCTQPVGSPEICKMSLCEGSCKGDMELFIIGKNIVKSCKVLFQDYSEHKGIIWQGEARIDAEYLHQTHLICSVPPYCNENLRTPVTVQVVLSCNGRLSEPRYFTYLPDTPSKSLDMMDSYDIQEWKILKSDYTNMSTFPIENCSLNSELSNSSREKPKESSFSHQMFLAAPISTNYSGQDPSHKPRTIMDWLPCNASNDISISSISTPSSFDAMSNSLDSNIQNDFMLHFSANDTTNMTTIQSESLNTLIESSDILTNL